MIFNIAGKLVETLQNGYKTAGVHEKLFEGNNLSAGNNVETREMDLAK
jgi:hypothetical protein